MDIRALHTLQQAIPVVLRHVNGYIELVERDWMAAKAAAAARLRAAAILLVSVSFLLLMVCLLVLALTWDNGHRVLAISLMGAVFAIIAIAAYVSLAKLRAQGRFSSLRREWRQDREVVDRWLSQ